MELLAVVALCVILFLLIGVPWLALASRSEARAASRRTDQLEAQIARLQQQIDRLREQVAGQAREAGDPVSPRPVAAPLAVPAERAAASDEAPAVNPDPDPAPATPPRPASMPPPLPVPPTLPPATAGPGRDIEELIGTRWAIWVGGAALALGSLFLVRVTIASGLFGPLARLLLAALLSGGLIWAGEMLRRGKMLPRRIVEGLSATPLPAEHAPLALTGAGTIGLFGTVYAAHALYGYFPQGLALVLLALVGLAAIAAARLHGQALAGIGLVGSYAAPLLVGGGSDNRWPVALYLVVVTAGGLAADGRRRTSWLGWAVIAGAALWTALLVLDQTRFPAAELAFMLMAMALFALAFCWLRPPVRPLTPFGDPAALVSLAGLSAAVGWSSLVHQGGPALHALAAALASALVAETARRDGRAASAILAAAILPIAMLLTWPATIGGPPMHARLAEGFLMMRVAPPRESIQMLIFACLAASAVVLPALSHFFRHAPANPRHAAPGLMAIALAGGLTAPLVALGWAVRSEGLARNLPAAAALALLCLALAYATDRLIRMPAEGRLARENRIGAGGFGAGSALALGLAIAFALPGLWMALGFAIAAVGAALLNDRRPLPLLRRTAAAFGTTALLRAVTSPVYQPADAWPILNSYIAAYGLPALLLAAASVILSRQARDRSLSIMRAAAGLTAVVFLLYVIRHAFHGPDLRANWRFGLGESGLYALCALGAALGLYLLRTRLEAPMARLRPAITAANGVGIALIVLLALIVANPWLGTRMSGPLLLDSAFVGFLMPAMALGWLAYFGRTDASWFHPALTQGNRILAIALGYLYCLTETRRAFVGLERFTRAYTGDAEQWAYSLVTLGFGVGLLAIGFRLGSRPTRLASAVFVILAVLKVFIVDMAELTGLLRALSFIALGGVLIGIGLAYQRLLFDRKNLDQKTPDQKDLSSEPPAPPGSSPPPLPTTP